jgi:hypothetical protein
MNTQTLKLNTPIIRGDKEIVEITLHKPNVGAMRGVSMRLLLDMNVDAVVAVLPRITDPQLTEVEINKLDAPDLLQAGILVAGFFLPPSEYQEAV